MKCWTVDRRLSAYLDRAVSEGERREIRAHLSDCPACSAKMESQQLMSASLRSLPRLAPPPDLGMRLRIMASKEPFAGKTPVSAFRKWRDSASLALRDLMKPIALPAAGGLCAAMLLFSSLIPEFTTNRIFVEDIPLYDLTPTTEPTLKSMAPIGFDYGDAEVDLRIDQNGRIVNFRIISAENEQALRRSIENTLLFTTFTPATSYGVPRSSQLRLSFRSSRIDVRG